VAGDVIDPAAESKKFRAAYRKGDRRALWYAIVFCAVHEIPMWNWLTREIVGIHHAAESGKFATWDDAFGARPWGKGHQGGARTRARRLQIYKRITEARNKVVRSRTKLARAKVRAKAAAKKAAAAREGGKAPEVEAFKQAKANAAVRKAERQLHESKDAEQKVWSEFGRGRKSVEHLFYSVEHAIDYAIRHARPRRK
jgi:hypothetical protein